MEVLPWIPQYNILLKLDVKDSNRICRTNKEYAQIFRDDYFWKDA